LALFWDFFPWIFKLQFPVFCGGRNLLRRAKRETAKVRGRITLDYCILTPVKLYFLWGRIAFFAARADTLLCFTKEKNQEFAEVFLFLN
jgi:hypothetical protein